MKPPPLLAVLAVFVGGLVGTGLRLGLDTLLPHATGGSLISGAHDSGGYAALTDVAWAGASITWSTVIVNLVGSLALGYLVARLWRRPSTPLWLKVGLGTGLLGSFTTFSAVAVNVVDALSLGNFAVAFTAVGFSLVGGLTAAWLGVFLGGRHATWSQSQRTRRLLDAIPDAITDPIPDAGVDQ